MSIACSSFFDVAMKTTKSHAGLIKYQLIIILFLFFQFHPLICRNSKICTFHKHSGLILCFNFRSFLIFWIDELSPHVDFEEHNVPFLMTKNSCHQQYPEQNETAAWASENFVVQNQGHYNMCRWVHDSFSDIPKGLHTGYTPLSPWRDLEKKILTL